jgi:formylglycine-generating enzyme required for sulfatase activity
MKKLIFLILFSSLFTQEALIRFGDVNLSNSTIDIVLNNDISVSGFQFEVNTDSIITIDSATGGSAEENGFTINVGTNNEVLLGYSTTISEIPIGEEILTILNFTGFGYSTLCISNALIVSGYEELTELNTTFGDCITLNYILGDVNIDEQINVADIVLMVSFILENTYPTEYEIWSSDISEDGEINISDIVMAIYCIFNGCNEEIEPPEPSAFEMVTVPAGDYTYGENDQTLNIDYDFEIMKYEVTNAQYLTYLEEALFNGDIWIGDCLDYWGGEECINGNYGGDEHFSAGEVTYYSLNDPWGESGNYNYSYISWNVTGFELNDNTFLNHPVVWVTWYGANAFALHHGMRLPTEYEWEKTARGNTGADYPWGENYGDDITDNANYLNSGDPWDNGTTPVGYFNGDNNTTNSPSPYGAFDMAGNVWEWTNSWWSDTDPYRVIRGGGWDADTYTLQSWVGSFGLPDASYYIIGFRLARTL